MGLQNNKSKIRFAQGFCSSQHQKVYIFMYIYAHIHFYLFKAQIPLRCGCSVIDLVFKYLTVLESIVLRAFCVLFSQFPS